jgi:hypothetical protein
MMQSESARMMTAAEARFRVQAANSLPRAIKVLALDPAGKVVVDRLARAGWQHATFFTFVTGPSTDALVDLAGGTRSIADEVATADLVVLVAGPGGHAYAAALVGEACRERRVMTTGFLVGAPSASEREVAKTLAQLRPWSLMVVIASNDDYIDDMMTALRA